MVQTMEIISLLQLLLIKVDQHNLGIMLDGCTRVEKNGLSTMMTPPLHQL